ncbi:hypothetical protein PIB30_034889 [Stylosanthes scabra]|uniref:Uncharacterized protein n=1 Tax=Stylosanthes scabra TaxID=79078 RepID=A0ABU6SD19_9FABA|nr:hypothetical protein [Stylosanthes scabra]
MKSGSRNASTPSSKFTAFIRSPNLRIAPAHLLDYLLVDQNLRTIKVADIVKRSVALHSLYSREANPWYPNFNDGVLQVPQLYVDGSTAHIFLNLIAYEMCPDFHNDYEITSFLIDIDSILVPETPLYTLLRAKIDCYYTIHRHKIKLLPWTIVALVAAALALVLTFI